MAYPPKAAFYEQYADIAIKQQQMYGIPASVTLAQMYIESAGGGSRLARQGNNYFGIKCPPGWVTSGKPYGLHDDDRPNEKFCYYGSVEESISHHSEFLMGKRYGRCQQLESTDYKGWATGLKACGYASAKNYATDLIRDIEAYGLNKYDQMAVADAQRKGITIGYARGQNYSVSTAAQGTAVAAVVPSSGYCFPLTGSNLIMSDGFGKDPTAYRDHKHNGIDISAKRGDAVVSTETGVVVAVKTDMTEHDNQAVRKAHGNTGGNYVVVEYQRADGESYRVSYCHLTENGVVVKKGDTVNAGTVLGYVGSTGNSTGPHLHLTVRKGKDGVYSEASNPLNYLAELSVRGNLQGTVVKKGTSQDLLASIKPDAATLQPTPADQVLLAQQGQPQETLAPTDHMTMDDNWLSKVGNMNDPMQMLAFMMGQNGGMDSGMGLGGGGNIISSMVSMLFMSAMALSMRGSGPAADVVSTQTRQEEEALTPEEQRDAVIMRQRSTVDPDRARQLAAMNFDSECPEAGESQGVRLA